MMHRCTAQFRIQTALLPGALFAWFVGGAASIWLLGIVITLPLLVFLYAYVDGGEKLPTSLVVAGCADAVISGLFEYTLEMRWPSGLLFAY
jgi:hypothetical protein